MYFAYFTQTNKYNYLFHSYFTYIRISFTKKNMSICTENINNFENRKWNHYIRHFKLYNFILIQFFVSTKITKI